MSFLGLGYDNLTHIYGAFIMTLIGYGFVIEHWKKKTDTGNFYLFLVIFFIGLGIGALVEIFELGAVLMFENTGVGGYLNNAFDLVRNAIGVLIASLFMIYRRHK